MDFKNVSAAAMLAAFASSFLLSFPVHAQTAPTPLTGAVVSWSTNTYVPPGFQGKRLPTSKSLIRAWVTAWMNGKPANLSNYGIQWYVNDQIFRTGANLPTISFNATRATAKIINLQARVQSADGEVSAASIQVPVVDPLVAVRADYPGGIFSGPSANVAALPYFFNIASPSALSFQWSANGVPSTNAENPDTAVINVGNNVQAGTPIRVQLTAANSADSTSATGYAVLTYQKL